MYLKFCWLQNNSPNLSSPKCPACSVHPVSPGDLFTKKYGCYTRYCTEVSFVKKKQKKKTTMPSRIECNKDPCLAVHLSWLKGLSMVPLSREI